MIADSSPSTAPGERDLTVMVRSMQPALMPNEWFFGTVEPGSFVQAAATVLEPEGLSVLVNRGEAERVGIPTTHAYRWITLRVHSSLEAVGLTAAVSAELTRHDISCNVIAGAFHDHVLVPASRADDAVRALQQLSEST